ncbi:MAG: D-alanyl-D-alanine carboxypeptidase family protein [Oscillospiraceae bacterium]|nr:D-alanyl-D-alanine carboxypeptidase family protein [Oscillospiraceae bacterium]
MSSSKRKSRKKQKHLLSTLLIIAVFLCLLLGLLLIIRKSAVSETEQRTAEETTVESVHETESLLPETTEEPVSETVAETELPAGTVTDISLSFYKAFLHTNDEAITPIVRMFPADALDLSEIWESSDTSVATVDENGRISPVGAGECTVRVISVSNPEISAEVAVKIYPEEEALPQPEHTLCEPVQNSSGIREDIQVIGGITYVNDIMLVNKAYPLPSDYNPGGMTPETEEAFSELRKTASEEAGLYLFSHSDFRSYHTQVYLYDDYCNGYGKEEADRFSARPGYSEHQTGMVIDVNWPGDAFNDTPEAIWLEENCWRFGFIVRFPREKEQFTGYKYESWHIRYVGKDWADKIYHSGLCLEEYFQVTSEYP